LESFLQAKPVENPTRLLVRDCPPDRHNSRKNGSFGNYFLYYPEFCFARLKQYC
jgi:hypothetical protein